MVAGRPLLYCDTDSIFYVRKLGEHVIREGDYLGEMSREMPDRRIVEWVCAGPKNYGFRHVRASDGEDEKSLLKIRGFTLNYGASKRLTFEIIRDLVLKKFR